LYKWLYTPLGVWSVTGGLYIECV